MADKTQTGLTQKAKQTFAPESSPRPVARLENQQKITDVWNIDTWDLTPYENVNHDKYYDTTDYKFDTASLAGLISPLDLPPTPNESRPALTEKYQQAAHPKTPTQEKPSIGIEIPADLKYAANLTEALTGYKAEFLIQKAFVESTLGKNMGKPNGFVYGYYQFSQVATHEGIEHLMKLPAADIIATLVPDIKTLNKGGLDTATEKALLDKVRTDPLAATLINAGYNARYTSKYAANLTGPVSYLIHFGGPGNGTKLINGYNKNPDTLGVALLRGGEKSNILSKAANRNIFYENGDTNHPRTVGEIVNFLEHEKGFGNHVIYNAITAKDLESFNPQEWIDKHTQTAQATTPNLPTPKI